MNEITLEDAKQYIKGYPYKTLNVVKTDKDHQKYGNFFVTTIIQITEEDCNKHNLPKSWIGFWETQMYNWSDDYCNYDEIYPLTRVKKKLKNVILETYEPAQIDEITYEYAREYDIEEADFKVINSEKEYLRKTVFLRTDVLEITIDDCHEFNLPLDFVGYWQTNEYQRGDYGYENKDRYPFTRVEPTMETITIVTYKPVK